MKIFVSSTFEDLALHREAVISGLRQLGHDVEAMEYFTADTLPSTAVVLEKVAQCEAFVGLFAWRYGYVPYPDKLPKKPGLPTGAGAGTSITHMEYLQAKAKGLDVLAFLLDEAEPWPPRMIDPEIRTAAKANSGAAVTDIRGLRQELQNERVIKFFKSPSDLEAKVVTAVTNLGMRTGIVTNLLHLFQPLHSGMEISEASASIRGEIEDAMTTKRRISTIDIGIGQSWWHTRIFLLAALAREFTDIERLVIVSGDSYVGMLSVATVLSRLGLTHRDLDRFAASIRDLPARVPDPVQALDQAFQVWWKLWPRDKESKHSSWVTVSSLAAWFGEAMHSGAVEIDDIQKANLIDLLRIHDYPNDFVPVRERAPKQTDRTNKDTKPPVDPDPPAGPRQWLGAPVTIVDSRSLNDRLAEQYLSELMDRNRLR